MRCGLDFLAPRRRTMARLDLPFLFLSQRSIAASQKCELPRDAA
jgi:hypothetical protein